MYCNRDDVFAGGMLRKFHCSSIAQAPAVDTDGERFFATVNGVVAQPLQCCRRTRFGVIHAEKGYFMQQLVFWGVLHDFG